MWLKTLDSPNAWCVLSRSTSGKRGGMIGILTQIIQWLLYPDASCMGYLHIFTYMHHRFKPNVGKYSIHGASGICLWKLLESLPGALRRLLLVHDMAAVGLEFEQFPITQHNPSIKLTRVNPETQKPEQEIACNLQDFQHNQFMMLRKKISDSRIKKLYGHFEYPC